MVEAQAAQDHRVPVYNVIQSNNVIQHYKNVIQDKNVIQNNNVIQIKKSRLKMLSNLCIYKIVM